METAPTEHDWRVVYRGPMTMEMADRLQAAGITRSGRSRVTGLVDAFGRDVLSHPLCVRARDADHAYVRLREVLGDQFRDIVGSPTRLEG